MKDILLAMAFMIAATASMVALFYAIGLMVAA
jgi:hypothetical protein